jgi:VCBS repeat-containing protein
MKVGGPEMAGKHRTMNRAKAARHDHTEAYRWLTAGAVTVGLGAALASGSGLALADASHTGDGGYDNARHPTSASEPAKTSGAATRKSSRHNPVRAATIAAVAAHLTRLADTARLPGTAGTAGIQTAPTSNAAGVNPVGPHSPLTPIPKVFRALRPLAAITQSAPPAPSRPTATSTLKAVLSMLGLSPLAANSPLAPVESPAAWALFAWARRQNEPASFKAAALITPAVSIGGGGGGPTAGTPTVVESAGTGVVTGKLNFTSSSKITYAVTAPPTAGSVSVASTGSYTYTPTVLAREAANSATTDSFTVTATNSTGATSETVTVPVSPLGPPVASVASRSVPSASTGAVTGNLNVFEENTAVPITYAVTTEPTGGAVKVTSTGSYTYTPTVAAREAAGPGTTDSFTVTATNAAGETSETVTVAVAPLGAPVAGTASVSTPSAVTGTVTGKLNVTGSTPNYAVTTQPTAGSVTVSSTGSYTYTPTVAAREAAAPGTTDSFTVTATNAAGSTDETVTVAVSPLGAPVAGVASVSTPSSTTGAVTGSLDITERNTAVPVTYAVSSPPTAGSVTVAGNGAYKYTPTQAARQAAVAGTTDSFTVTATNAAGATSETVTVPVAPLSVSHTGAPVAGTASVSTPSTTTGVVTGDLNVTGSPEITYTVSTQPAAGSVTVSSTGAYTYTPTLAARKAVAPGTTDSFTVTAVNSLGQTTETVTVAVAPLGAPVAGVASKSVPSTATGSVTGNLNVTGSTPISYAVTTQPVAGSVTVSSTGAYIYTPTVAAREAVAPGTTDSFTVTATNAAGATTETVTVAVAPLGAPVAGLASVSTPSTTTGVVTGSLNVTGSTPITYPVTAQPTGGAVTVASNGVYKYTPTNLARFQAYAGGPTSDSFTVLAANAAGGTTETVTVPISPSRVAPYVVTTLDTTFQGSNAISDPLAEALTPDGSQLYVVNYGGTGQGGTGTMAVINTATGAVTGVYDLGAQPTGVAISPVPQTDGTLAYIANSNNTFSGQGDVQLVLGGTIVNLGLPAPPGESTVNEPEALAYSPDGNAVYVAVNTGFYANNAPTGTPTSSIFVVPTGNNTASTNQYCAGGCTPIPVGGLVADGQAIAVSPNGSQVYVVTNDPVTNAGSLSVISNGTVTGTVAVGNDAGAVAVSPDGNTAYVTASTGSASSVSVINTSTDAVSTINLLTQGGQYPVGVAVSPNGGQLYVLDGDLTTDDQQVQVINTATGAVVETIPTATTPGSGGAIAVSPNGNDLYVTDDGANTVTMIALDGGGGVSGTAGA